MSVQGDKAGSRTTVATKITEAMIEAGVDAYVKWYGEHDCWTDPDAIVFSNGIAAAYLAMEAARAKAT